ncbi:MAG: DUF411 domain-containing protein [Methylococcaceae bacterium]|nr:MAG: DUF411 domain-containing protein [Methylococcaceae bacterium]
MKLKSVRALWMAGALLAVCPWVGMAGSVWDKLTPAVAGPLEITVYRSPSCGCCGQWLEHMTKQGFHVNDMPTEDMDAIKRKFGVAPKLASCHTAFINGYVIEGHVPAGDVKKLLQEKPAVAGLTVPGMVSGSPGMEMGGKKAPFTVLSFDKDGNATPFSEYSSY